MSPARWSRIGLALVEQHPPFEAVFLALLLGAASLAACGEPPREAARNVVLISIDTLRPDMLGSYGYPRPTSPTLDALAREGVRFETAVAPSPWTLPSHASLLTGLYPRRHGLKTHDQRLASDVAVWAELLRSEGFVTAAVVNSLYVGSRPGFDRGFDSFVYLREGLDDARPSRVRQRAVQWLESAPEGPFFLFVHFFDVHSDYASLPEYERRFVRPYGGAVDGSTAQLLRFRKGQFALEEEDRDHLVDLYVAGIRQLDDEIARLVADLERRGLLEHTLLIVTSDHGEEFLEHGGVLHGRTQYDEMLRVPLILRGPGVPADRVVSVAVSLVDVLPTALGLLGVQPPEGIDGRDVASLWSSEPDRALIERELFGEADHNNACNDVTRSVRRGRFKLHYDLLSKESRLFDLVDDPGETRVVSERHPERVAELAAALEAFLQTGASAETLPPLDPEDAERLKALGYM